jgi:hypothetical protein
VPDFTIQELALLIEALDKKIWSLDQVGNTKLQRRLQFTLLHVRVTDYLAQAKKREGTMVYQFKEVCQVFKDALTEAGVQNELSRLDIRLGLEQIVDDPDFRAELTARWADPEPWQIELGPDESIARFRMVSPRHALSIENIKAALEAVVDTDSFQAETRTRWARFDETPWPLQEVGDLAAMPTDV